MNNMNVIKVIKYYSYKLWHAIYYSLIMLINRGLKGVGNVDKNLNFKAY